MSRDQGHAARGLCGCEVITTEGERFICDLADDHEGWHTDVFILVDERGLRLRCELRWDDTATL